jgi:hypothetical protein
MKNIWPNEVRLIFMAAAGSFVIDPQHAEKLKAHINRLWLADTPEETIIYEISILAEAMEGELCAG